jgi:hypothetical protein
MRFEGAVIREQGVSFAIVVVKKHVVNNTGEAQRAVRSFASAFPGLPVILMAQDGRGVPTYFGRRDIANFLAGVSPSRIPWREYTLN